MMTITVIFKKRIQMGIFPFPSSNTSLVVQFNSTILRFPITPNLYVEDRFVLAPLARDDSTTCCSSQSASFRTWAGGRLKYLGCCFW